MSNRKQQRIVGGLFLLAIGFLVLPNLLGDKKSLAPVTPTVPAIDNTSALTTPTVTEQPNVPEIEFESLNSQKIEEVPVSDLVNNNQTAAKQFSDPAAKEPLTDNDWANIINVNAATPQSVTAEDKSSVAVAEQTKKAQVNNDDEGIDEAPIIIDETKPVVTEKSTQKKQVVAESVTKENVKTEKKPVVSESKAAQKPVKLPEIKLLSTAQTENKVASSTTKPVTTNASNPSTKTPANTSQRWFVQLGVFSQQKNAQDLYQRYRGAGYPVNIENVNGQYRVRIGPYAQRNDANRIKVLLQNAGQATTVVGQ